MNATIGINISKMSPSLDRCLLPSNLYDAGCLTRNLCPQINSHIIKVGIIIIVCYIIYSWLSDWFFKKGYKLIPVYDYNNGFGKFIGNLNNEDTRIYWINWLKNRWITLFIAYITMIIYFNF